MSDEPFFYQQIFERDRTIYESLGLTEYPVASHSRPLDAHPKKKSSPVYLDDDRIIQGQMRLLGKLTPLLARLSSQEIITFSDLERSGALEIRTYNRLRNLDLHEIDIHSMGYTSFRDLQASYGMGSQSYTRLLTTLRVFDATHRFTAIPANPDRSPAVSLLDAMQVLTPKERIIIEARFQSSSRPTLAQVGKSVDIGTTRAQALEQKALHRLKRALGDNTFAQHFPAAARKLLYI